MGSFTTNVPMNLQPSQTRTQHYYLDPPGIGHRLLTRDGTAFYLQDQGVKTNQIFVSSAPTCKGNMPEHIHMHGIWRSRRLQPLKASTFILTFAFTVIMLPLTGDSPAPSETTMTTLNTTYPVAMYHPSARGVRIFIKLSPTRTFSQQEFATSKS